VPSAVTTTRRHDDTKKFDVVSRPALGLFRRAAGLPSITVPCAPQSDGTCSREVQKSTQVTDAIRLDEWPKSDVAMGSFGRSDVQPRPGKRRHQPPLVRRVLGLERSSTKIRKTRPADSSARLAACGARCLRPGLLWEAAAVRDRAQSTAGGGIGSSGVRAAICIFAAKDSRFSCDMEYSTCRWSLRTE